MNAHNAFLNHVGYTIALTAMAFCAASFRFDPGFLETIVNKLQAFNSLNPQEKLYSIAFGDFALADTLHEGKYLVRAYTNYMRNVGEDFFLKGDPNTEPLACLCKSTGNSNC